MKGSIRTLSMMALVCASCTLFAQTPSAPQAAADAQKTVAEATPDKPVSPKDAGAAVDPKTYRIGPEDVLLLSIWREEALSGLIVVRPDGKINLKLVGEVEASDKTPMELEQTIAKAYSTIMKNPPIVNLQVQRVESKKYYLTGEVMKPGAYPLIAPTTVFQALIMSGGIRDFGNPKKIVIIRGSERIKFNYSEVVKGKKLEQNIQLKSGDTILVP